MAAPAIERGRIFMPLSVGALIDHMDLVERAPATGARIVVPTGALLGLDAVRAAAEGKIASVKIVTRKPPAGLAGAPLLVEQGIAVDGLEEPLKIFEGSAREAIAGFPANVNVAVALSLAGIGPDATRAEIWADPRSDAQHAHHRAEIGLVRPEHDDREHPLGGEPADGQDHGAERARRAAPPDRAAGGGELSGRSRTGGSGHATLRRPNADGNVVEMAGDGRAPGCHVARHDAGAGGEGLRAARVEGAARRQVERIGRVAPRPVSGMPSPGSGVSTEASSACV